MAGGLEMEFVEGDRRFCLASWHAVQMGFSQVETCLHLVDSLGPLVLFLG